MAEAPFLPLETERLSSPVTLEHASRWYGQVIGVNDVSCAIPAGITALVGPNGAGKSTLIKLVTGQLRPTTGRVRVLGERPFANGRVFRRLGYCPEYDNLWDEMTGREFVMTLATLGGLRGPDRSSAVQRALETVGMAARADHRLGSYSKGMRQRVKIAQAIVHDPDVLILDEPLNGLDPAGRHDMAGLFASLAVRGKCILVSSHILYEVEHLTRRILLMHHGRLLAHGDIYQIRALIDEHPHRVTIRTDRPRDLATRLLALHDVLSIRLDEDGALEVETRAPDAFYHQLPDIVLDGGFLVASMQSPDNNLEAVFRYLVSD